MDPLAFPVLAGSALTQGFGFLYSQLQTLLERRRAQRDDQQPPAAALVDSPAVLIGRLQPLQVNRRVLAEKADELTLLDRLLSHYADQEELDGRDPQLRTLLGQLRATLERIYGQHLTFQGEDRPVTGLRIDQRVEDSYGYVIGLEVGEASSGVRADISHEVRTVHPGSTVVGARIEKLS